MLHAESSSDKQLAARQPASSAESAQGSTSADSTEQGDEKREQPNSSETTEQASEESVLAKNVASVLANGKMECACAWVRGLAGQLD